MKITFLTVQDLWRVCHVLVYLPSFPKYCASCLWRDLKSWRMMVGGPDFSYIRDSVFHLVAEETWSIWSNSSSGVQLGNRSLFTRKCWHRSQFFPGSCSICLQLPEVSQPSSVAGMIWAQLEDLGDGGVDSLSLQKTALWNLWRGAGRVTVISAYGPEAVLLKEEHFQNRLSCFRL